MEEAEAGLLATNVLAVRRWWFEARWLVLVHFRVKTVAVCQSIGSSSQTEDFLRSLRVLICCIGFLRL